MVKTHARLARWGSWAVAAATLILTGCASIEENLPKPLQFSRWFDRSDPLLVLRDSNSGVKRSEAMLKLREPIQNGGTHQQQDAYVAILVTSAQKDGEPLCRLSAISMLGKYKDPRAVFCLKEVLEANLAFTPEINTTIRQRALASLEEIASPHALDTLIKVARQPGAAVDSSLADRMQTLDERLAALRALAKYSQYNSVETLLHVMETEKDVALRERAYESLCKATGKNLPPDPVRWRQLIADPHAAAARSPEPGVIRRTVGLNKN